MIQRQFETTLTFDRAPVQMLFHETDAETVGNSYRAKVRMTYDGHDWKADVLLIESQDKEKQWVKDALPRDEIELIEGHLVEMYESEEAEVA